MDNKSEYVVAEIADFSINTLWWIAKCCNCFGICLVTEVSEQIAVLPNPKPTPANQLIPKEMRETLDEAKVCFQLKCYRASAAMARRCVEMACCEKKAEGASLAEKIDDLEAKRLIPSHVTVWAHALRCGGNDAVHSEESVVGSQEAESLLALVEQLLEQLYVHTQVAEQMIQLFKNNKQKKKEDHQKE
jgi:hypothetical protein